VEFTSDVPSGVHIATSERTMDKTFFSSYAELPLFASGKFRWAKPAKPAPGEQFPLEFSLISEPEGMCRCESTNRLSGCKGCGSVLPTLTFLTVELEFNPPLFDWQAYIILY
jgi:hypothetical protein